MTDSQDFAQELAAIAADSGARTWRVLNGGERIEICPAPGCGPSALDGVWAVEAFLREFDGFHRSAVLEQIVLAESDGSVSLSVELCTGGTAHFMARAGERNGVVWFPGDHAAPWSTSEVGVAYQPIVRLLDGSVVGYECLARIRREDGATVSVETAHPILGIGPEMARRVIDRLKSPEFEQRFLNLNLSACELADEVTVREIAAILEESGVAPGRLNIELTERAAIRDWGSIQEALSRLRAAGAGIVLDDFGAGHSSMLWLSELAVDGVKLDGALLGHLDLARGRVILSGLLKMLRELDITVVVEGIESVDQIEVIRSLGAELGQGFALGRPENEPRIDAP